MPKPVLKKHQSRFSAPHIAKKAGLHPNQIINTRSPILWSDAYLRKAGFHRFEKDLQSEGFVCFSLKGLGSSIYYDYLHKAIYFDGKHYGSKPASLLFHRILIVLKSVSYGYYPFLKLHPEKHLLPLLNEVNQTIKGKRKGLSKGSLNPFSKNNSNNLLQIKGVDIPRISSLYSRVGYVSISQIKKLQTALWNHLYTAQMGESLDIVGLTESIVGRDLILQRPKPKDIVNLSKYIVPMLDVATKLRFDAENNEDTNH